MYGGKVPYLEFKTTFFYYINCNHICKTIKYVIEITQNVIVNVCVRDHSLMPHSLVTT